MYYNKLAEAINSAVIDCMNTGSGVSKVKEHEHIEVLADWETWDKNSSYDVISVYIKENGIIKFNYQDDGTIVEQ